MAARKGKAKGAPKRKPVKKGSSEGAKRSLRTPTKGQRSAPSGAPRKKKKETLLLAPGARPRKGAAAGNGAGRSPAASRKKSKLGKPEKSRPKTKAERAEYKRRSEASRKGWRKRRFRGKEGQILHQTRLEISDLHGASKGDWYTLKEMMTSEDERFLEFLELAEDLGLDEGDARDEWMSPKAKG